MNEIKVFFVCYFVCAIFFFLPYYFIEILSIYVLSFFSNVAQELAALKFIFPKF